jgi:hypothetical protein
MIAGNRTARIMSQADGEERAGGGTVSDDHKASRIASAPRSRPWPGPAVSTRMNCSFAEPPGRRRTPHRRHRAGACNPALTATLYIQPARCLCQSGMLATTRCKPCELGARRSPLLASCRRRRCRRLVTLSSTRSSLQIAVLRCMMLMNEATGRIT